MSLRFIYGKSGTGKSTFCFKEIKKLINNKEKVYIITPEQFSFTAEKELINNIGKSSVINAQVISFERIAYRVINEVGEIDRNNITNCGKAMLLYNTILEQKNKLRFLGKTDKNIDLITNIISELKKNNIKESDLEDTIKNIDDQYIKLKLEDINLLYKNFNLKINEQYLDDNDLLTIIKDKIKKSNIFNNAHIYIDEFSGFTKQEYLVIEELLKVAKQVNVVICTDSLEINQDTDIFSQNKNIFFKIKDIAQKNSISLEKEIELKQIYEFKNEELKYLSENLYSNNTAKFLNRCTNIKIFLAMNTYSEVENIANNIVELVRDNDYRYQDIGIITKDIDEYSSLIKPIFNKYNIPVFIDQKKSINQNILIKYIISVLDIFLKSWSIESVLNYIKSGLVSNLDNYDLYKFENYCKKYGISGFKKFNTAWQITTSVKENIEELNNIRLKIISPLLKFKNKLGKNKTVQEITESLYILLEDNNIQEALTYKIEFLKNNGNIELANIYNASWNLVINIFDELVCILGKKSISFEEYIKLLKVGFNNSSLGKIPATLDEVILGDVDRSKGLKRKIIFIIGLNDGKFPSSNKSEGFISDDEREYLKINGIGLSKTKKEQLCDENFNIYKVFSNAKEKLFLSYSASDNDGKGLRKSILVNRIKNIFPSIIEESDIIKSKAYITSKETTFDFLLLNIRKYLDGENIDNIWFDVYTIYSNDKEYKQRLYNALEGFYYNNIPNDINKQSLQKLYGEKLQTSISKLENYKRCPFSYYLKYALKLSDSIELKLERLDTGTFMHDIINEFFNIIKEGNIDIKDISDKEIENIVENIVNSKLRLKQNYVFNSIPKYVVLTKRLQKVITNAIKYIVDTLRFSDFKVLGTEIEFGNGKQYDPIKICLEDGKQIQIIGKIDRVDIAENKDGKFIRIIDYKSSIKNIDLNEVVAGIQIQLLTYLDAVAKKEDANLAGVLYFNLIEPIIKSKNKHLTQEQLAQEIKSNFKMNGLILGDVNVIKMMDNKLSTGASSIIPAYIDKSGNLSQSKTNSLNKNEFKKLQNKIESTIKEISKNILNGVIEQKPVYLLKNKRTACEFCNYKSICGFDAKICNNNYNYIPNLPKSEIL